MKIGSLLFIFLLFFSLVASAQSGEKVLYDKSCKTCHGIDGKGNAKLAAGMKIVPELLDLTKQSTKDKKDAELTANISDGVGKMKGFKDKLKSEDMALVVSHIRTLQK